MKRLASLVMVAAAAASLALAQSPGPRPGAATAEEIVRALDPVTSSGTKSLRGVEIVNKARQANPSIDLTVNFEFNSAKLETDALIVLKSLGTALKDERLARFKFLIAGHTDAKGSDEYNRILSDARAKAVRDHLIFFYEIDRARLVAVGYGEAQLARPDEPDSAANRRVQIVNQISP